MTMISRRSAAFFVVVTLFLAISADLGAVTRPGDCNQKCVRGIDTATCQSSTSFGAGRNCVETSACTVYAVDADGAGPGSPQIFVTCTYSCQIEYCYWV